MNCERNHKQVMEETSPNARESMRFGFPATPALTPPVSLCDDWNTRVRAGLLDSRTTNNAGERDVKKKEEHRGKPPLVSLTGRAGFSTPFPEGVVPSGSKYFSTHMQGGRT
jgi:hypothetical protein